ncbi:MAG: hypothetical protein MRJ67_01270 [Nitrospirales bacterium]|nr:hypothetical protein [Nitrospira sp.]MDR4459149.1 hypothetical protein [Nitrospirales bacterium]MDR4483469.1 hypothetical protein [Nitrospirales bacterium]
MVCDNSIVDRLLRSVQYEDVDLHAYDPVSAARKGLESYFGLSCDVAGFGTHTGSGAFSPSAATTSGVV